MLEDGRPCDNKFNWSASGQKFYEEQGYRPPRYCWECRKRRNAERAEGPDAGRNRGNG